ncbi:hypothetical protein [Nonomuraea sp. K271]|uniref:hypothetical protein n=1 Tax=Nonomuraea sp. K271 TaxID=1848319 RepID=UPI001F476B29|nr:hypothetical protein [Nonomuraea sp. K271]
MPNDADARPDPYDGRHESRGRRRVRPGRPFHRVMTLLLGTTLAASITPATAHAQTPQTTHTRTAQAVQATRAETTHTASTEATRTAHTGRAGAREVKGRVAVVGVPGLEWSDVDRSRTPHLWDLVSRGSSASLSTRTVPPPDRGITCPTAGWLTVSAGQRAGTPGKGCSPAPGPRPSGRGATIPGWDTLSAYQGETGFDARLGTLGRLVREGGGQVAAIGPGAALAAADTSGNIPTYAPDLGSVTDLTPYDLVVFEAADLATAWASRPLDEYGVPTPLPADDRRTAVARADRQIGALIGKLPAGTSVLVAGISDVTPNAHLHVAIATGPSAPGGPPFPHGRLTATSTRQDSLVTITDLTATAVQLLGLPATREIVGRPWRSEGAIPLDPAGAVMDLADADLASQVLRDVRGPFFTVLVTVQLLFYVLAALALRRRSKNGPNRTTRPEPDQNHPPQAAAAPPDTPAPGSQRDVPTRPDAASDVPPSADARTVGLASASTLLVAVQAVAVVSGAIPVSTFLAQLVPWWTLPVPMVSVIVTIVAIAALITAAAFAGPWRSHVLGPLTVVAAVTSLALLLDVMTGSTLQVNAVTGYEPVTGGRFYGFSNIAFAVYATGTVLGLAGVAQWLLGKGVARVVVVVTCAVYGGLAVFADGWPSWGADFGGVPAFVVGLAVFLILLSGRRVSALRLALVGLAGALLVGTLAVFDWLRPEIQRTHLGGFVQQIIDGQAWTVVWRKFTAMVGVTVGNWSLTLLTVVALAFLFLVLARPSRWGASALGQVYALAPVLRAGLFGTLTCAFVAFLMNDSGIAIPSMALTVAVPLTLAACVRALQLATPTPAAPRSGPAAPTRAEA